MALSVNGMMDAMHSPATTGTQADELRAAQRRLDQAVVLAYGWHDLDLGHAFREVPTLPATDRTRFTISGSARAEVLRRLAQLNRKRFEAEQSALAATKRRTKPPNVGAPDHDVTQGQLELAATSIAGGTRDASSLVFAFLRSSSDWHAKADVLAATGITDGQWNAAIAELLAERRVERQGERRGARYRTAGGR
jgi:hypothetical protein